MTQVALGALKAKAERLSLPIPVEMLASWENSQEAWCVKDIHGVVVYLNDKYQEFISLLQGCPAVYPQGVNQHDERVLREVRTVIAVGVCFDHGLNRCFPFYCERSPILTDWRRWPVLSVTSGRLFLFLPLFFKR
ncbi:Uncharacterised protein [Serratia rubidaea]|uniref:Uncharacterized protein n=1 Tax=Serratia rubidaea TaxID=61652 RepID=A0A447QJB9_SERRU|nr:Uncharacterised protein [Serratia rubidaea]